MENLKIGHKIQEYRIIYNITIKKFAKITNLTSLFEEEAMNH